MSEAQVRRWTGAAGVAGFVVFLIALPLYVLGPQPMGRLEDSAQFADAVGEVNNLILARTSIADPLILACLLVFVAGFSRLIRQARPDHEWLAAVVFGAGLVVLTLELVGDGLAAGAALDTSATADPTVVRGLWEASIVFYGGIGLMMSAVFLAALGFSTLATGIVPRWIGRLGYAAAAINLAAAPTIFAGTNVTGFYTANGYVTFLAQGLMLLWFLAAGVAMLRRHVDA
ncbi:MAG: hypothetical protein ACHQ01_10180 [Candidatus Limnocylindrales bacterium]